MNALLDRISINPEVCGGKPRIKGTRLWVSLILDFLADGTTEAELIEDYPHLTHEDVMAAIAYGAEMSRERVLPVPLERVSSMKIELDENMGARGTELLRLAGHDVMTVQVLRFPPDRGAGLVILEPGGRLTPGLLLDRLRDFLALADVRSPRTALWIVEPGRIRIHLAGEN